MQQERKPSWFWGLFSILAAVGLWGLMVGQMPVERGAPPAAGPVHDLHPGDLRYFHDRPGESRDELNPADASVQVKGVAANRHVPMADVRSLMEAHVDGRDQPLGRQRVQVRELNQALDEKWPAR